MSRRTAEASKAVREKWEKERELILEGKGTRQWTQKQQKDILEKGKAYDEKGRAFEGQHMQSVDKYPEYQGDSDNIQLLSRDEHFEAHDYNWQNPTNWYFDPVNKTKKNFGNGKYIPCEVIQLENPIVKLTGTYNTDDDLQKSEKSIENDSVEKENQIINVNNPQIKTEKLKKIDFGEKFLNGAEKAMRFTREHPVITKLAVSAAGIFASAVVSSISKSNTRKGSATTKIINNASDSLNIVNTSLEQVAESIVERATPSPNVVKAHKQRYNTKEGVIWKEKASYSRGKER